MSVRKLFHIFYDREAADNCRCKQIHIINNRNFVLHCNKSVFAESKGCPKENSQFVQLFEIEYSESDNYHKLTVDMPQYNRNLFHSLFSYEHFNEYKDAIVKSPYYEVPAGTMPDTGTKPYKEKSSVFSALSENRYIKHVITEERAERYVPALPEFSNIFAYKRVVEVLIKVESEYTSEAYGNIGIA